MLVRRTLDASQRLLTDASMGCEWERCKDQHLQDMQQMLTSAALDSPKMPTLTWHIMCWHLKLQGVCLSFKIPQALGLPSSDSAGAGQISWASQEICKRDRFAIFLQVAR